MLIWLIVTLLACAAAVGGVLPLIGWTSYLVVGVCSGYVGTLLIAFKSHHEMAPHHIVIVTSIIGGGLIGLFWPAAAVMGIVWIIARRRLNAVLRAVAACDVADPPSRLPGHQKSAEE